MSPRMMLTYSSYQAMLQRCLNPLSTGYRNYGGRGIKVARAWRQSFQQFVNDMGLRPGQRFSIHRRDPNKGYTKANCVWARHGRQACTKRSTRWFRVNGRKLCLRDFAKKYRVHPTTLSGRLKRGWSLYKAIGRARGPRLKVRQIRRRAPKYAWLF